MAFSSTTFLSDTILFTRDFLSSNLTDPIASSRDNRDRFVMTSYPNREVKYPVITVKHESFAQDKRLGQQTEAMRIGLPMEIRVWARNIKEKDELSQEIITKLRQNVFGTGGSVEFEMHDFFFNSSFDVDEDGDNAPKSRIMTFTYKIIVDG